MTELKSCGTSGTVAAVTKVHYLYDVSCCLAMDRERLRGISSKLDVTSINFHILLGESRMLQVAEGRLRDTCFFILNCLPIGKCH
jgi:hypothetical protein